MKMKNVLSFGTCQFILIKKFKSNRPDQDQHQELKTCLLIDIAVPAKRNTFVKMVENLVKYIE